MNLSTQKNGELKIKYNLRNGELSVVITHDPQPVRNNWNRDDEKNQNKTKILTISKNNSRTIFDSIFIFIYDLRNL